MSAADQGSDREYAAEPSAKRPGEPDPGSDSADLAFDRLLAQLEAEGNQPSAGAGISQIFAPSPARPDPDSAIPRDQQRLETGAFALANSAAFAPEPAAFAPEIMAIAPQQTAFAPAEASLSAASAFAPAPAGAPTDIAPFTPETKPFNANPNPEKTPAAPAAAQSTPSTAPANEPGITALFASHPVPSAPPTAAAAQAPAILAKQPLSPTLSESSGEFTRIFTQLPTPRSAPPAILSEVSAALPPSTPEPAGEFTQFFRALDPRPASDSSPATPTQSAPVPAAIIAPASNATQPHPDAPTPPQPNPASTSAASSFAVPSFAAHPALSAASNEQGPAVPAAASDPAPKGASPTLTSEPASPPFSPAFATSPAAQPAAAQAFASPAFAPSAAAQPRVSSPLPLDQPGAFTALFQAATLPKSEPETSFSQPRGPLSAHPGSPALNQDFPATFAEPPRAQPTGGGGFTELLHSLGSEAKPAPSHLASPTPAAADRPYADAFSPAVAPAPSSPAFATRPPQQNQPSSTGAARPGEFTELMQSLQAPQPKPPSPTQTPASSPAMLPSFLGTGEPISSAGPSEFTRIMQGSAARSAEAPVAQFAPAPQPSGAAVGLPIAAPRAPKPPALPTGEAKSKLQAMMPLLLAANGTLLLLLIALAFMFLRHKH